MGLLNNVVWALSNLCRGKPVPQLSLLAPAIGPLSELLYKEVSDDVLTDTIWALSYLSDGDNDRIEVVMQTGLAARLVAFLGDGMSPKLQTPTVRCLGNFATGSDSQTQEVIDAGLLDHLVKLLESPRVSRTECHELWLCLRIFSSTHYIAIIHAFLLLTMPTHSLQKL